MPIQMVLTLEDFVMESLDFINSDAYYSLKKECLEFQLESLNYTMESKDILNTVMLESSNSRFKVSDLKNTILKKISIIWAAIIKALKTFLKNIINVLTNGQNKQIDKIKAQCKESEDKIDSLLKNKANDEEKINQLKAELDRIITSATKQDSLVKYLQSTNFDKHIQLRHLNAELGDIKVSHEVEGLHLKILSLMDANKNNKEDVTKILNLINLILVEEVVVHDVPVFIFKINDYVVKFKDCFAINKFEKTDDIILLFVKNYINAGTRSVQKINIMINGINALKGDIQKSMEESSNGKFTVKSIEDTHKVIQEQFPTDSMFTYNSDKIDSYDDAFKKILDDNSELFSKYVLAISELSAVFKSAIGEYINYTKDIVDGRQWALKMEASIINVIRRIDMNA